MEIPTELIIKINSLKEPMPKTKKTRAPKKEKHLKYEIDEALETLGYGSGVYKGKLQSFRNTPHFVRGENQRANAPR